MKKTIFYPTIILMIALSTQTAAAIEVFCKSLPKAATGIRHDREQVQTASGMKTTYLAYPYQILRASPSHSPIGAGDRGLNLKTGECGLKSAPFADKFTSIQLTFVGGTSFTVADNSGASVASWTELGSSCCKVYSFEADLVPNGAAALKADIILSRTPITYY